MKIDTSFSHNYEAFFITELTRTDPVYYYPDASKKGGKDGLMIKIIPKNGSSWVGIFAFGIISQKGSTGFYTTPDPDKLCVVSNGMGYFVNVNNPQYCETIDATPIMDIRIIADKNILVFADYTQLIAYDEFNIKWKTKRLAWDGFQITEVSDDYIQGKYYDIRSEKEEYFKVNLNNGNNSGGVNSSSTIGEC